MAFGVPAVQLTTHVKSSILYGRSYGRKSKFFRLNGLLLFCIIMELRSASSAISSEVFETGVRGGRSLLSPLAVFLIG